MSKTSKKAHPAETADREAIAQATGFNVHLRHGPHSKVNEPAKTLAEAVAIYDCLAAQATGGRKPLIYAVLPNPAAIFVPLDMGAAARVGEAPAPKVFGKKFNAQRSARASGLTDDQFTIRAVEGGFIWEPIPAPVADVTAPESVNIEDLKPSTHPIAAENAASWPTGKPATKATGKRAAILEAAQRGEIPDAPDFSAATHARFRKKLDEIVALVKSGDLETLKGLEINPASSSRKAMARYRDLAVIALEARVKKAAA